MYYVHGFKDLSRNVRDIPNINPKDVRSFNSCYPVFFYFGVFYRILFLHCALCIAQMSSLKRNFFFTVSNSKTI